MLIDALSIQIGSEALFFENNVFEYNIFKIQAIWEEM